MDLLTMIMACSLYPDNNIPNAMIQLGSQNKPLTVTTVMADGSKNTRANFKTIAQASQYARSQIDQGYKVEMGVMQVPSSWMPKLHQRGVTVEQLFRPCKNILIGTDILNHATGYCASESRVKNCALSVYKTGNTQAGREYAHQVLQYAKTNPLDEKLMGNSQNTSVAQAVSKTEEDERIVLPAPTFDGEAAE